MAKRAAKRIYRALPMKRHVFTALRAVWQPPHRIARHLSFLGRFTVHLDATRSFRMYHYGHKVENDLFWHGPEGVEERDTLWIW